MGAVIADVFSEEISHFVCSNASTKRLKAAAIFEITVVNPLWVENCFQSGTRVSESDFIVSQEVGSTLAIDRSSALGSLPRKSIEPIVEEEKLSRRLSSPHYSSTKQEESLNLDKQKKGKKTAKETVTKELSKMQDEVIKEIVEDSNARVKKVSRTVDKTKGEKACGDQDTGSKENIFLQEPSVEEFSSRDSSTFRSANALIPLPSFKEVDAVVRSVSGQQARRSERIFDNVESLEDALQIDVDISLPIIRGSDYQATSLDKKGHLKLSGVIDPKLFPIKQNDDETNKKSSQENVQQKAVINSEMKLSKSKRMKISDASLANDNNEEEAGNKSKVKKLDAASKIVKSDVVANIDLDNMASEIDASIVAAGVSTIGNSNMERAGRLVIAISGFEEVGEKETLINGLQHLIATIDATENSTERSLDIKYDRSSNSKNQNKSMIETKNKKSKSGATSSLDDKTSSIPSSSSFSSSSSCSSSSSFSSAVILGSEDDIFGVECTHVILHSSSSK